MYDNEMPRQSLKTKQDTLSFTWESMPEDLLLQYYAEIRQSLGDRNLANVDMESELVLQMQAATALQGRIVSDANQDPSKQAAVINATSRILQQVAELQAAIYTSERLKKIESRLIKYMRSLDQDEARAFLTAYEQILGE